VWLLVASKVIMMCHCQVRLLKRARNRIVFGIVISNILGFLSFEYRSGVTGAKSCFSEQPSDSIGRSYPSARRLQGHWCQGVLPTLDMWNPRFQKRSHPAIVIFSVKKNMAFGRSRASHFNKWHEMTISHWSILFSTAGFDLYITYNICFAG